MHCCCMSWGRLSQKRRVPDRPGLISAYSASVGFAFLGTAVAFRVACVAGVKCCNRLGRVGCPDITALYDNPIRQHKRQPIHVQHFSWH